MSIPLPSLDPKDYEIRKIQYMLQQQLNNPLAKIVECYDVTTVSKAANFDKFMKKITNKNVVHAFIPIPELRQPLSDIVARGVRVHPQKGLKIHIDNIILPEKKQTVLELVHCIVALGQTQNYQSIVSELRASDFESGTPTIDNLLDGYDSLRIDEDNDYWIFDQSQIRTLQLIRVTGHDTDKEFEIDTTCALCHKVPAKLYCVNCDACLCAQCDEKSHHSSGNRLLESHNREKLERAFPQLSRCPFHPQHHVEHFCPVCQLPVCLECKLRGNHSRGENARHELVPLADAYNGALRRSDTENRNFGRRRRAIAAKLRDAEVRMRAIEENQRTVEDRIMEAAKAAILKLRRESGERALAVRSARLELERRQRELDSKAEFLLKARDADGAVSFVQAMHFFDEIAAAEMADDEALPVDLWVDGDLALVGQLDVRSRLEARLPDGAHKRDYDVEERDDIRVTDFPTETDTFTPAPTTDSYTYTYETQTKTQTQTTMNEKVKAQKLSVMAERRLKRSGRPKFAPFEGSKVLSSADQAITLYAALPFKSQPQTHLLYSSERDGRSARVMHKFIDGVGITAVLVRRGAQVFGGFAAARWNSDGKPFAAGSSTFMFQLTKDAFLPYSPTMPDAVCLLGTKDSVCFGQTDLVLQGDLDHCSSSLEVSFSAGLRCGSKEADTFLAGSNVFSADIVEVWGFFTSEK